MNIGDMRRGIVHRMIENELSPLWQQIVEATKNGDGMTEKETGGESGQVKLNILDVIYNALLPHLHPIYMLTTTIRLGWPFVNC